MLNLILGPVCEVLFYKTIIERRLERDLGFIPYWFRKLVLIILSPLLVTVEEIWRACVFFSKTSSLKAQGGVQHEQKKKNFLSEHKKRKFLVEVFLGVTL